MAILKMLNTSEIVQKAGELQADIGIAQNFVSRRGQLDYCLRVLPLHHQLKYFNGSSYICGSLD
jgi:hypothetical protein